jgi:hypothetical protein
MMENWMLGGASSLTGVSGLPTQIVAIADCEAANGASWLDAQKRSVNRATKYTKTADAPVFVQHMNLHECRGNCPSFDKLCRELAARILPDEGSAAVDRGPVNSA